MVRKRTGLLAIVSLLVGAMLLSLAGCGSSTTAADSKTYKIGAMQIVEHPALDAAYKGFKEELDAEGIKADIDFQNAQGDMNTLNTIATKFVSDKKDLIFAIATPSAQAAASQTKDIPIVATAVTDFVDAKLAKSNEAPGGNVTGTSDMNPVDKQIDLGIELVPAAQTVGFCYNSSESNSILQINLAKKEVEAKGLKWTEVTVTGANDVQQAIQSLVTKCDFIYLPTDNTLASAMATVAGVTNPAKKPVIAAEPNMVKGGALGTVGVDYESLGKAAGKMAADVLKNGKKPADMPIQFAENPSVVINKDIVTAISITIPDKYQSYIKAAADIS